MSQEDVKIYRAPKDAKSCVMTDADQAADEYRLQCENGNLCRAHNLGGVIADCFLGMDVGREFAAQKWVMLSYLADNLLEQGIANPLLQKSAAGRFHTSLEESSPDLSRIIHDSRAYTLYALNENRLRARSEGEVFAELCERPGDQELIACGEKLARSFESAVREEISKVQFVP